MSWNRTRERIRKLKRLKNVFPDVEMRPEHDVPEMLVEIDRLNKLLEKIGNLAIQRKERVL